MNISGWIRRLASRARLHRIDDSTGIQAVQVELLAGEIRNLQRLQDYGITSVPLPGAEGIALALNGDRAQSVIIKTDDRRHRITELQPGEVCIYTHEGDTIHLKRGRKIEINGAEQVDVNTKVANVNAATSATIKSAEITLDGPVVCKDTLTVEKVITGQLGLMVSGAAADINGGTITETGDFQTAAGISLDTHEHTGGTEGDGTTGGPQ